MQHFTPLASLAGGVLIGLASAAVLFLQGRVLGISGICGGILRRTRGETTWRVCFVLGLLAVGAVGAHFAPANFEVRTSAGLPLLAGAGVLVGFGTRLSNGCTSGHGVCGLARGSRRSLAATLVFMLAAAVTVFVLRHGAGAT